MKSVLLIRLSSLGDLVLTLPALDSLRRRLPNGHLALVVGKPYAGLFQDQPPVDQLITVDRSDWRRNAGDLSSRRWDLVIDLQGTRRSRAIAASVPAGERRTVNRDRWRRWSMVWGRRGGEVPHVTRRFLEAVGGDPEREFLRPQLPLSSEIRSRARTWLEERGGGHGKWLALFPGASHPVKAWPPERFAAVGRMAEERWGFRPLVLGGENDRDVVELTARLAGGRGLAWWGNREIPFMASLMASAEAAVSNDSGGGHLAAAVGTRVVTIFGPTVIGFGFAPRGGEAREVFLPLRCRPCSLHGNRPCRLGTQACLRDIPVESVLDVLGAVVECRVPPQMGDCGL